MNFSRSEVKSGILVVTCFILLMILTFKVSDFRTFGDYNEYQLLFDYVSGLETNAPVHFAGHHVGKVKTIQLREGSPAVQVTIEIVKTAPLRKDSDAFVDTLGLLGEKFISLTPGKLSSPLLEAGGTLRGTETIPLHHMIRQMNTLTENMIPLTEQANQLMKGHEKDLESILVNLNAASENLKDMTQDLKLHPWKLLRKGEGRRRFLIF